MFYEVLNNIQVSARSQRKPLTPATFSVPDWFIAGFSEGEAVFLDASRITSRRSLDRNGNMHSLTLEAPQSTTHHQIFLKVLRPNTMIFGRTISKRHKNDVQLDEPCSSFGELIC